MTDKTLEQQPADTAEAAMNRVLEAEQAAARLLQDYDQDVLSTKKDLPELVLNSKHTFSSPE